MDCINGIGLKRQKVQGCDNSQYYMAFIVGSYRSTLYWIWPNGNFDRNRRRIFFLYPFGFLQVDGTSMGYCLFADFQ